MLRTIGYLVLAWFVFRTLDTWWSLRKAKQQRAQNANAQSNQRRTSSGKNQEIIVTYDPRSTKSAVREDVGEVVEFEEVKDESKS